MKKVGSKEGDKMKEEKVDQLMVKRNKREPFFKMKDAHYHQVWEIYYLFSGDRKFFINDSIYNVYKGDLVLIEKGAIHRTTYSSDKTHERIYIYLPETYLMKLCRRYGEKEVMSCFTYPLLSIPQNRRTYIETLLMKIESEYNNGDIYSELLIEGYLNELMIFILRYENYRMQTATTPMDQADEQMQQAARYILGHYKEQITLGYMAQFTSMSPSYFSKRFKEATGFGFKEYLLNVRMKQASKLLLETKMSITEVAYTCGFNDSNYFGDVFKKMRGMPPIRYRKNNEFI